MNCPVCNDTRMREVEKNGIMIDICPSCKGVWLDRGELEKLMAGVREVRQEYNEWYYGGASPGPSQPPAPYPPQPQHYPQSAPQYPQPYYDSHPQGYPGYKGYPYKKYKKKKSVLDVLGDLFD